MKIRVGWIGIIIFWIGVGVGFYANSIDSSSFMTLSGFVEFVGMAMFGIAILKRVHKWWISIPTSVPKNKSRTGVTTQEIKKPSIISESDLQNQFSRFSWRQMEELTGKLFEKKGYDVEVTQASADFGIDVWASKNGEKVGIQVKHWSKDVGFDDVTKTLGSNLGKANRYILISTKSFFTNQAWEHQKQHAHLIELWDTNKFRQELRDNFVNTTKSNPTTIQTNTDSFDYDKGFNIDEVYDTPHSSETIVCKYCSYEMEKDTTLCGKCGRVV